MWEFDMEKRSWTQIISHWSDYKPLPRSGHTMFFFQNRIYIFGGSFEITKELNDLVLYDFKERCFKLTMRSLHCKADPNLSAGGSPKADRYVESIVMNRRQSDEHMSPGLSNKAKFTSPRGQKNKSPRPIPPVSTTKKRQYANQADMSRGNSAKSAFSTSVLSPVNPENREKFNGSSFQRRNFFSPVKRPHEQSQASLLSPNKTP